MGAFGSRFKLNHEKVGGGAPSTKLPPGEYVVRIEKNHLKESENKQFKGGPFFVSEFTVLEVISGGEKMTDVHGNFFPQTKPGDYRSWSNDMSHPGGPGSLNEFLAAVDGVDPTDATALEEANLDFESLADAAIAEENEMRGCTVRVRVTLKKSGKNKQNDFMLNQFSVAEIASAA